MRAVSLLYRSHLAPGCGPKELEAIRDVSRKNNDAMDVTGALCYSGRGFLQCLEGPMEAVNELYRRIVRDDRHRDVTLLEYFDIDRREFREWSMAYVREEDIDREYLLEIRGTDYFDPFDMTGGEAMEFLKQVVRDRMRFLERQKKEQA